MSFSLASMSNLVLTFWRNLQPRFPIPSSMRWLHIVHIYSWLVFVEQFFFANILVLELVFLIALIVCLKQLR